MKHLRLSLTFVTVLLIMTLLLANPPAARAAGPFVSPSGGGTFEIFCLFADGFEPFEELALWVQFEDGVNESAGSAFANSDGKIGPSEGTVAGYACVFGGPNWPSGPVLFVARGTSSHHEQSATFLFRNDWAQPPAAGLIVVPVPGAPIDQPFFSIAGSGFKPFERYSAWVTWPDGTTHSLGDNFADENGNQFGGLLPIQLGGAGDYVVVHRSASGLELSARFTFYGYNNPQPSAPGIKINPDNGTYQNSLVINATGFLPYEAVAVWYDEPDGEIYDAGTQSADENGVFKSEWLSTPGEPFGVYTVHLYGLQSHLLLSGTFEIHPIPLKP